MRVSFRGAQDRAWIGRLLRVFAILLGCVAPAAGQGQYSVRVWQAEDGLPVNNVHSVVQTDDAYLWIATAGSIVRFDGLRFEEVVVPTDFVVPAVGLNRLFAAGGETVWFAGARGGLLQIEGLVGRRVEGIGGAGGGDPLTQVIRAPDGEVLARNGGGCWRIEGPSARRVDAPDAEVAALFEKDLDERSDSGRIGPDGKPGRLLDEHGSLWLPDGPDGLTVSSPEGVERPVELPGVGADFLVHEMLEDREGNIWVATPLHGVALFREDRVDVIVAGEGLRRTPALAVIEDGNGDAWIANRGGGIDRLSGGEVRHHPLPVEDERATITALYEDRNGRLWAASREGPVFRWLGWRFVEQFIGQEAPSRVNAIYHDADGVLWFGGRRGLARLTGEQVWEFGTEGGFPGGEVTVMSGGVDGELWFGTAEGYVVRNLNGRLTTIGSPGDLAYRRVSGILVEASDRVWVTTLGSGLFLFNGTGWQRFDRRQGLPDAQLTHVVSDGLGHLWFGSTGGILRASREDLLVRAADGESPIHWLRMDRSDGLPTRECVGGYNPAGWRFKDGSIWFPTMLGVVRLDPSRTKVNRTPPPVYLRGVQIDGIPVGFESGAVEVGPGDPRLEFEFQGVNFSAPEKVTYRVRLGGIDEGWREIGSQRQVSYGAVPPGDYRFEVLAMNGDGAISETPASLAITVKPRFWETAWFAAQVWVAAILLAAGIGVFVSRLRFKRRISGLKIERAREAERARIARDLHDDLGASLTEISLLAGLSAEQAEGSEFQGQLDELSSRSREVARALDEIVWAVNPREDHFGSLIDYLGSFATEFTERAGIQLRLMIPPGLPETPMDTTLRHSVFLSVREAFNNLVKHSGAGTAWLRVAMHGEQVEIRVEDDGKGVREEEIGSGEGLLNYDKRMRDCRGSCTIEPRPGGGTVVAFRFPLLAPGEGPS